MRRSFAESLQNVRCRFADGADYEQDANGYPIVEAAIAIEQQPRAGDEPEQ